MRCRSAKIWVPLLILAAILTTPGMMLPAFADVLGYFRNGSVSPASGSTTTKFSYNVELVANKAVDIIFMQAWIDGTTYYNMSSIGQVVTPGSSWFGVDNIILSSGSHTFYFRTRLVDISDKTNDQIIVSSPQQIGPTVGSPPAQYWVKVTNNDDSNETVYFKTNQDTSYHGGYNVNANGGVFGSSSYQVTPGTYSITLKWKYPEKTTDDLLTSTSQIINAGDNKEFDFTIPKYIAPTTTTTTTTTSTSTTTTTRSTTTTSTITTTTSMSTTTTIINHPPTVTINAPSGGSTVSGNVTVNVDGIDPEDGALTKIEYYLNNNLIAADCAPKAACPSSTWIWNTSTCSSGAYALKVIGYDKQSATGQDQISITVNNSIINQPPVINVIAPWNNDLLCGRVSVQVETSDPDQNDHVTKIEYYVASGLKHTENNALNAALFKSNWNEDFNGGSYNDGSNYSLTVKAYDTKGGFASKSISFKIDRHPIVLIVPHPDDEILGCGGLVYDNFIKSGKNAMIIVVTNGDANETDFTVWKNSTKASDQDGNGKIDIVDFGYMRQKESQAALAGLGISNIHEIFLGYPDGGLTQILDNYWDSAYTAPASPNGNGYAYSPYANSYFWHANYKGSELLADLKNLLSIYQPGQVYFTHLKDTHPDHNAIARFVYLALKGLAEEGKGWASNSNLNNFLVHWGSSSHWPNPGGYKPTSSLSPPTRGDVEDNGNTTWDWESPFVYNQGLPATQKYTALSNFQSQMTNQPETDYLYAFARINELFWPRILPKPSISPSTNQLTLVGNQTREVFFYVANNGGPASDFYIDVSLSPELEIVNTADWTKIYKVGDKIWKSTDKNSPSMNAAYTLCESSRPSFGSSQNFSYRLAVRSKNGAGSSGWIKYRVAMNMAGVTVSNYNPDTYVRYPCGGAITDQQGWPAGQIPVNLTADKYVVADEGNNRILVIDKDGNITWNSTAENISLSGPAGALETGNYIYLVNQGDNKVQRYDLTSRTVVSTLSLSWPHDVASLSSGKLLICGQSKNAPNQNASDNKVIEINSDFSGTPTLWYGGTSYSSDLVPVRACQNGKGEIFIALQDNKFHGQPKEISKSKIVKVSLPGAAPVDICISPTAEYSSVTLKSDGHLLACDYYSGKVIEIDGNGNILSTWAAGLKYPTYAVQVSDGSVLIVESGANRIIKMTNPGTAQNFQVSSGLNLPVMISEIGSAKSANICVVVQNSNNTKTTAAEGGTSDLKAGVEIKRYSSDGSYLDSRITDSNGEAWWYGIIPGSYSFNIYKGGICWGGTESKTVQENGTDYICFSAAIDENIISGLKIDGKTITAGDFISNKPVIEAIFGKWAFDITSWKVEINKAEDNSNVRSVLRTISALSDLTTNNSVSVADPLPEGNYYAKVTVLDSAGNATTLDSPAFKVSSAFSFLALAGPNPFSPNGDGMADTTKITYQLSGDARIKIRIVSLDGRAVKNFGYEPGVSLKSTTGYNEVEWDGRDETGALVNNGLYLCYIMAESGGEVKKTKLKIAVLK